MRILEMVDAQKGIEDFADFNGGDRRRGPARCAGVCRPGFDRLLIAFAIDELSGVFLAKDLNGRPATFVRFEGPDQFAIQRDGAERMIFRDEWRMLPERLPTEQDRPGHQDYGSKLERR
jgi:hypothetical protein